MMKKRVAASIIACTMMFANICAFASSYATYTVNGDEAALTSTGNLGSVYEVPVSFSGNEVCKIGADAFKNNTELEQVILPKTVSSIEWGAFEGCKNLKTVNIPASVSAIEDMTFSGCGSLKAIAIPNGVNYIGVKAFAETALEDITLPASLKAVEIKAFSGCKSLKTVTIGSGVTYIGENAFEGCKNLTLVCKKDSFAQKYAEQNGIKYIIK